MIKFKYRYCKVHMAKYLSGDLSDITRRRIARFIDESQDCYDEYLRQREITDQLQRSLPAVWPPGFAAAGQHLDVLAKRACTGERLE